MLKRLTVLLASVGMVWGIGTPILAQTCTPLTVVGGSGTSAVKEVSPPSAGPFAKTNWNTDFVVPEGAYFSSFEASLTASEPSYKPDIKMFLKYPDNTADNVYAIKALPLMPDRTHSFFGYPRANQSPYQVNVFVGGLSGTGLPYTLTVSGCK